MCQNTKNDGGVNKNVLIWLKKNNVMTLLVFIRYLEIFLSFFLFNGKKINFYVSDSTLNYRCGCTN